MSDLDIEDIIIADKDENVLEESIVEESKSISSKYKIKVILDIREKSIIKTCQELIIKNKKFENIFIETKALDLGDITICDIKTNKELVIIERKTLQDLISSIKDNRYKEQGYRLENSEYPNHNIVYMIEGDNISGYTQDKDMIYSSMFSLFYFKGFSIFRTKDIKESAYVILNSAYKIAKEEKRESYYNSSNLVKKEITEDYTSVVKKKKNSNITPENFGEIVLMQVPSISNTTAKAIMSEFKTVQNLINSLKEDEKCLDKITTTADNGKSRKISKTSIKNIITFLLA
jgi:crossover junction endonuclease MUS81